MFYNLAAVFGLSSFNFIANPMLPFNFNFPWKKAYNRQVENIIDISESEVEKCI